MTNLKTARAEVNKHKFGTPEWEAAMEVVRAIVAKTEIKPLPKGVYFSGKNREPFLVA
jgi:hypothetical protein